MRLTPQKPLRRAYERDEKAVKEWLDKVYPKIKKYVRRKGAEIFWLDEASIRSDDPLQRTWGEKGKTPVVKTSGLTWHWNLLTEATVIQKH